MIVTIMFHSPFISLTLIGPIVLLISFAYLSKLHSHVFSLTFLGAGCLAFYFLSCCPRRTIVSTCFVITYPFYKVVKYLHSTDPYGIYRDPKLRLAWANDDVRLLYIHPGRWDDEIKCDLKRVGLGYKPEFEALSYSWKGGYPDDVSLSRFESMFQRLTFTLIARGVELFGDPRKRLIWVNKRKMPVAINLELGLRHLREGPGGKVRCIWVDAICINQDDVEDRNNQINSMKNIYRRAQRVIVWLGPERNLGKVHLCQGILSGSKSRLKPTIVSNPRDGEDVVWQNSKPTENDIDDCAIEGDTNDDSLQTVEDNRVAKYEQRWRDFNNMPKLLRAQHLPDHAMECFCMIHLLAFQAFVGCNSFSQQEPLERRIPFLLSATARGPVMDVLEDIIDSLWWQRLWVVQETVFAQDLVVRYGRFVISWQTLVDAAENLNLHRHQTCCSADFERLPQKHIDRFARFAEAIINLNDWRAKWKEQPGEEAPKIGLLQLLWNFRDRTATNPRDKIYALLNLVNFWGDLKSDRCIVPRYGDAVADVYKHATRVLIEIDDSLRVLMGNTKKSVDLIGKLPSWVADWSAKPSDGERGRLERTMLYDAASGQKMHWRILGNNRLLELHGVTHDTVSEVSNVMTKDPDASSFEETQETFREWEALAQLPLYGDDPYIQGPLTKRQAYVRTLCMNTKFQGKEHGKETLDFNRMDYQKLGEEFEQDCHVFIPRPHTLTTTESQRRLHRGLTFLSNSGYLARKSSMNTGRRERTFSCDYTHEPGVLTPVSAASDSPQDNLSTQINKAVSTATVCRRFFITKQGYMGLGPDHTRPGDKVVLLFGSRVPFLIRSAGRQDITDDLDESICRRPSFAEDEAAVVDNTSNHAQDSRKPMAARAQDRPVPQFDCSVDCHKLIGDCFVLGIMGGEAIHDKDGRPTNPDLVYLV